jgi:asparagine synthase (glutamine-hydrolysing)
MLIDAVLARVQEQQAGDLLAGRLAAADGADASLSLADLRLLDAARLQQLVAASPTEFALGVHLDDGSAFLAVDRFAVKSLCWRIEGSRIRFAERADALAERGAGLDPQALFDYLYFHVIPSPRTVFSGVFRLPPGHCAIFRDGQLRVLPYWVPSFEPARAGAVSFDALKAEFRGLLRDAVGARLDGGKAGCFLSGGTDSSTVAGLLHQAAGGRADAYSIGFEAEGYDEMAYARIAAQHFGVSHHAYYVTPDDLVAKMPEVARFYDQPFGNSSAVPAFYCARMARDDGVTRILAGDGGDELFGGNSRYAKQRVFGWWDDIPGAARGTLAAVFDNRVMAGVPLLKKGSSYIEQARVPLPDRLQTYNLLQRLGVAEVLTPAFRAAVDAEAPMRQQREAWALARAEDRLDRQLAFDWRYTLAENDLPKVCGTTRMAGLEVGFPMLDARLVDFSLRLPTAYKLKGLKLRWFFKEALRGFLPDQIITKKKQGFGLPFGVWAARHPALKALAADSLASLATRGIVQPVFIHSLMGQRMAEHAHFYGEMVWILTMLEQWLQGHAPDWKLQG